MCTSKKDHEHVEHETYDISTYATSVAAWYETKRRIILEESNQPFDDSTVRYIGKNSIEVSKFLKGVLLGKEIKNSSGTVVSKFYYSRDLNFELFQGFCPNNNLEFEKVNYQGHTYGLFQQWNCDGLLVEQGCYYNDQRVGIWQIRSKDGHIERKNFGNEYYANLLPEK
jgi:hypothetical protein